MARFTFSFGVFSFSVLTLFYFQFWRFSTELSQVPPRRSLWEGCVKMQIAFRFPSSTGGGVPAGRVCSIYEIMKGIKLFFIRLSSGLSINFAASDKQNENGNKKRS
jgi:hypothetical protein